jgi:hypothetical protein
MEARPKSRARAVCGFAVKNIGVIRSGTLMFSPQGLCPETLLTNIFLRGWFQG